MPFLSPVRTARVDEYEVDRIVGWVAVRHGVKPLRVSLQVDGREIAATTAAVPTRHLGAPGGRVYGFRFLLWEIWNWLGPENRISVVVDGESIPFAGRGLRVEPIKTGNRTVDELHSRMAQGWVFSRVGKFQLSKKVDTVWQDQVITLSRWVRTFMKDNFDYDAFYTYGSLLGAVRERGFMGHDVDLDMGYVSRHRDASRVGPELHDIGLAFIADGWEIEPFRTHLHVVKEVHHARMRVDLFSHFFDEGGALRFPYGQAGTSHVRIADWQGVVDTPFLDGTAPVPGRPEPMLAQLYGRSWRQPQPGFSWRYDRKERAKSGLMPRDMCEDLYWSDHFARHSYETGSSFCEYLSTRTDIPSSVVDLGCGDGRDAIAFAGTGRRAVGVDRSTVAIERATAKAARVGLADASFVRSDLRDHVALDAVVDQARAASDDGSVLFHLRFVLQSLTREVQETLLRRLADRARPGDRVAMEFRTTADEDRFKLYRGHYRRFQDVADVAAWLRDLGLAVLDVSEGTNLSPMTIADRTENPVLGRIVAAKE